MPSFLSDELSSTTLDESFYQTFSESRHTQEKAIVKAWPAQQPTIRSNYQATPPRTPTDSFDSMNGATTTANGGMFTDTGLNGIPNGRTSGSGWEDRLVRDTSALSVNGSVNRNSENGRKSPVSPYGLPNVTPTDRNSFGSVNGGALQTPPSKVERATTPQSLHGDSDISKRVSTSSSATYNLQSTGPLTYASPLVPTVNSLEIPVRNLSTSTHRVSSPLEHSPKTLAVAPPTTTITGLPQQTVGPPQLKHRNTLQVPKIGPPRGSIDDAALSTGRFSPTVTPVMRRGSLSLNRRNTQSIHSNMPHEDLVQDEDALRWAEAIRQKRASKRKRKDEEDDDRVVVGTKVDQNHVNWVTAYNMLTGIRFTVSRTNAKLDRPLTDADFGARHKFSFDM